MPLIGHARAALAAFWVVVLQTATMAGGPLHFGDPVRWLTSPVGDQAWMSSAALFGRVNADKKVDLVLYSFARGEAYVALSDGTRLLAPRLYASGLPKFTETTFEVALADVNGDGLDDLIIMNHGADNVEGAAIATVALNTGSGFSLPLQAKWNASWCASYQRCLAADINGDHKADLVAFTPQFGTVWGTLSTGGAFGANAIWNNFFCIVKEVCALGDVDGDGKADAILFKPLAPGNQKGNVLWARSTGSGFVDVRYGHGYFCIDAELCMVGDVNGDGKADIALIKGFGSNAPNLEVLVSLSNGTQFINATPFAWAHPPYFGGASKTFGSFALADVTGDGRADLVEYGPMYAANAGGGQTLAGFGVDVFAVTDQTTAGGGGSGGGGTPAGQSGYASVSAYNCHPDQHRVYYWTYDMTTGNVSSSALTDAMYSETGFCPDPNDSPDTISLTASHVYTIVAVDPEAIGCEGRNDPSIAGCVSVNLSVRGASGAVCKWIIGAQQAACAP